MNHSLIVYCIFIILYSFFLNSELLSKASKPRVVKTSAVLKALSTPCTKRRPLKTKPFSSPPQLVSPSPWQRPRPRPP